MAWTRVDNAVVKSVQLKQSLVQPQLLSEKNTKEDPKLNLKRIFNREYPKTFNFSNIGGFELADVRRLGLSDGFQEEVGKFIGLKKFSERGF